MPPKCTICTNEKVDEVNSLLAQEKSFRYIALQILGDEKHFMSVSRHAEHLGYDLQIAIKEKRIEKAIDHYQEISEQLQFAKELRLAAREYLTDPETGRLVLIPRAREITVIYEDYDDLNRQNEPKKKRGNLDALLEKLENVRRFQMGLLKEDLQRIFDGFDDADYDEIKGKVNDLLSVYKTDYVEVIKTEIKHIDIRQFALNAVSTVDLVLDKVAKKEGLYQKDGENKSDFEKYRSFIKSILDITDNDVRRAVLLAKDRNVHPPSEEAERKVIAEFEAKQVETIQ